MVRRARGRFYCTSLDSKFLGHKPNRAYMRLPPLGYLHQDTRQQLSNELLSQYAFEHSTSSTPTESLPALLALLSEQHIRVYRILTSNHISGIQLFYMRRKVPWKPAIFRRGSFTAVKGDKSECKQNKRKRCQYSRNKLKTTKFLGNIDSRQCILTRNN